jgi:hypothetical protein
LALAAALAAPGAFAAEVVAHGKQADSVLSRSSLRGMFGMRLRAWPDGTPVRVFVMEDSDPLHQEFCEAVLQMYPYQLRQNWDRLLYSGTGQVPILVHSEEEMLRRIADTPGAIGYVRAYTPPKPAPKGGKKKGSKTQEGAAPAESVKVLHVRE